MPPSPTGPGIAWRDDPMTKSELIEQIAMRQPELSIKEVESAVRLILDDITDTLAEGGRVEIRGSAVFPCIIESRG